MYGSRIAASSLLYGGVQTLNLEKEVHMHRYAERGFVALERGVCLLL